MIKNIIFDFDGVIADSFDKSCEVLAKNISKYSRDNLTKNEIKKLYREKSIFEIMKKYNIKKYHVPILYWKLSQNLKPIIHEVKLFPNIKTIIKKLKKENYKIGILSSNHVTNIKEILIRENLIDEIDFIAKTAMPLNKDSSLKNTLNTQKLNLNETIYISDEYKDYIACEKINMKCILVTYGFNSKKLLETLNPKYLIDKPEQIFKILKLK